MTTPNGSDETGALGLRAGEWVEVRSKAEILRTLDKKARLDNMPFMPGMFEYCGRRLRVGKSAHKTCDTINWTGGRRVEAAVHLEDVRCAGKDYDGCQAGCLIFWKEAWLKRVDGPELGSIRPRDGAGPARRTDGEGGGSGSTVASGGCTEADVVAATKATAGDDPTYVCQATEVVAASKPLAWWDVRQYVKDYQSGNADARRLLEGFAYGACAKAIDLSERSRIPLLAITLIAAYDRVQGLLGGVPWPRRSGTIPVGQKTPTETLNLQPGERVRVKSYQEILATLDRKNKNRGLYFDAEHVPYCGGTYRVLSRVNKIIEEKTGKMISFKSASIILEGVACQSCYSDRRMFCPRAIYPYWREIWLERAEAPVAAAQL